ncbi:Protein of unknown function [Amycolatopsis arida]|uniref:DUF3224 domain-containing protein n=1 Tax=Amycolatopsis arida TaxID=587909 RepID=A0A1I5UVV4_9PSEU|nr:DUF3224 domain-containing protein [Amycolatopsis arida]TDX91052.1 uncharacterized protein DUF3224 [Amycolatopsis arida]SFP99342.1 Protein of unknown function [Amycolatopsis arida]
MNTARRPRPLALLLLTALPFAGVAPAGAAAPGGRLTGVFTITSWNESTHHELPGGARLIHLTATDTFAGGITGEAWAEEEHLIRADGTRDFAGMIVVTGRVGTRAGGFVIRTTGTFDGHTARSDWRVVPDSGTGGLRGLRGVGGDRVTAADGSHVRYTLTYWFDH